VSSASRICDSGIAMTGGYPNAHGQMRGQAIAARIILLVAALIVIQLGNVTGYFDTAAPMAWFKLFVVIVVAAVVMAFLVELGFRRGALRGPEAPRPTNA
jgi:hypothetical protein